VDAVGRNLSVLWWCDRLARKGLRDRRPRRTTPEHPGIVYWDATASRVLVTHSSWTRLAL